MPEKLTLLIRSGNPLISIDTTDEDRALELAGNVAKEMALPLFEWSMTRGLNRIGGDENQPPIARGGKADVALQHIHQSFVRGIYVFKDIGPHCKDAHVHRLMRDLMKTCAETVSAMILVDSTPLPDEIKRFVLRYELAWPSVEELEAVVKETFKRIKKESLLNVTHRISKGELDQLVQSLRGLSCVEAERVFASAIYDDYALTADDLAHVVEAKRTLLGSAGCLESIVADFSPQDIGGLENLKGWLKRRRGGFTKHAREFGLEPPRGVLMLGVPGCGKSLCAKVVAADWKMPLLRLDPGVLYQKFIGESESQLRQALRQAEAMAPAVLWIDEIEKAFASASAGSADGGLSKRMFGTLLSWMQDHRHPIFIVATANDISALPPELMRKGRFDEVFFIDLPTAKAREQILGLHLRRRNRHAENFNVKHLAEATDGFSGSELEQAVISGLFAAYNDGRELADEHILTAIGETRPLSILMAERVAELRAWSEGRCVSAD